MKKLIALFVLASTLTLVGCGTTPMIQKDYKDGHANGYTVKVTNHDRIPNKNLKLTFEVSDGANVGQFDWNDVQSKVLSNLKSKGIKVTDSGLPVTVYLDDFIAWNSTHARLRINRGGYLSGGTVLGATGSVIADVAARAIDRKIKRDETLQAGGDGKNFVGEVKFSIKSDSYSTAVEMKSMEAIYGYVDSSENVTVMAISEFFTGQK